MTEEQELTQEQIEQSIDDVIAELRDEFPNIPENLMSEAIARLKGRLEAVGEAMEKMEDAVDNIPEPDEEKDAILDQIINLDEEKDAGFRVVEAREGPNRKERRKEAKTKKKRGAGFTRKTMSKSKELRQRRKKMKK